MKPILWIVCIHIVFNVSAQPSVGWEFIGDFPGGSRDDGSTFVIENKGYYCCGSDLGFTLRNDCFRYNINTNEWSQVASIPGNPRQYTSGFSYDSLGFVFGGIIDSGDFVSDLWIYNSHLDSWTVASTPLEGRAKASALRLGKYAYIFGGVNDSLIFGDLWRLDIQTMQWKRIDSLPMGPRFDMVSECRNGVGYCGLGQDSNHLYKDFWVFESQQETWQSLDSFPGQISTFSTIGSSQQGLYIIGGDEGQFNVSNEVYLYSPELNEWNISPERYPISVRGVEAMSFNAGIVTVGGITSGFSRVTDVYKLPSIQSGLKPEIHLWPNPARLGSSVFIEDILTDKGEIVIYDSHGFVIQSFDLKNLETNNALDVRSLPTGLYIVHLVQKTTVSAYGKLIITK